MSIEEIIKFMEDRASHIQGMALKALSDDEKQFFVREASIFCEVIGLLKAIQMSRSSDTSARLAAIKDIPTERVLDLAQAEAAGLVSISASAAEGAHPDAQPNEPLTLEALREMDGQPVWIDRGPGYGVGWVLVQVWAKSTNIIYLIQANGSVLQLGVEIKNGAKLYRRLPKEEQV